MKMKRRGFAAAVAARGPVVLLVAESALEGRPEGASAGLGEPVVRRAGEGLTLLAEGAGLALALAAPAGPEVVDLRGCRDAARIGAFVARTGRAVVVGHDDPQVLAAAFSVPFWRLEAPPLALPATAGVAALSAALTESFTP